MNPARKTRFARFSPQEARKHAGQPFGFLQLPIAALGGNRWQRACTLAVGALFASLLLIDHAAASLGALLALAGLGLWLRAPRLSASEREFLLVMAMLPAGMLLNMALTQSWDVGLLNRPMRLMYGFLMFLALVRIGFADWSLFWGCALGALGSAAVALVQTEWLGLERAEGFTNAVPFGNYALLLGTVALAGGLLHRRDSSRPGLCTALGLVALLAAVYASVASGSRGGWLALPGLLLGVIWACCGARAGRGLAWGLGGVVLAVALLASSPSVQHRIEQGRVEVQQFLSGADSDAVLRSSTALRLQMWQWGLQRFAEHPLTGIGYAHFSAARRAAVAAGEMPPDFAGFANLHNEPINTLAMAGLPGALCLAGFWFLGARFFVRRLRRGGGDPAMRFHALAGLLVLFGTGVFSLTEALLGTTLASIALAVFLATPAAALVRREHSAQPREPA